MWDALGVRRLRAAAKPRGIRKRSGGAGRRSRDPHWDNIRYFSGTLVVSVHMMAAVSERTGLHWLYLATWPMRVPVFVIVAGYFSRADSLNARETRRLVESVAVPYLLIGLLHTMQETWWYGGDWKIHLVEPAWGAWFLLSLLFWRAGLPYLAQLRYPLTVSVIAALAVGYISDVGTAMSLSRTITFLPFFLLGWKIRQGLFNEALRARWSRHAALGVVAATFVVTWFIHEGPNFNELRMKAPYPGDTPLNEPWAWTARGAALLFGMVVALSVIRLIPRRRLPVITYLGAGGLYIYLLHPLVLRVWGHEVGFDWLGHGPEQFLLFAFAVALSAALASPPLRWLTRPLVQPRLPWLFRRPEPTTPPAQRNGSRPPAGPTPVPAPAKAADRPVLTGGGRGGRP
jgi:fucose 4-O-acetylase-like acetyltransferase